VQRPGPAVLHRLPQLLRPHSHGVWCSGRTPSLPFALQLNDRCDWQGGGLGTKTDPTRVIKVKTCMVGLWQLADHIGLAMAVCEPGRMSSGAIGCASTAGPAPVPPPLPLAARLLPLHLHRHIYCRLHVALTSNR
jgi:hypothetical protein